MYFLTRLVFYTFIAGTAHSVLWSCWMSHVISSTDICGQSDYYLRSEQRGQRVRGQITKWDRCEWVSLLWGTTKVNLLILSDPSENSRFVSERVGVAWLSMVVSWIFWVTVKNWLRKVCTNAFMTKVWMCYGNRYNCMYKYMFTALILVALPYFPTLQILMYIM